MKDPLAAVPLRPDLVEMKRDDDGIVHLRLTVELKGLRKKIADLLGYDYTAKVSLDKNGSVYYRMVDGVNTLRDIAKEMARTLERSREEAEKMVVLFTRDLMTRNMIVLRDLSCAECGDDE